MVTIEDYLRKVQFVRDNILDESERSVLRNEQKIIDLNVSQITESEGSDGNQLKNTNSLFKGRYTLATQLFSEGQNLLAPKIAGDPYNFLATGDFFRSFEVDITPDLTKIEIKNTGTGSGSKKIFFDGYSNLLGLNNENAKKTNEIIKSDIDEFIKKHL